MATDDSKRQLDPIDIDREMQLQKQPLELDDLIASGLLTKDGAWYLVANPRNLPEHVAKRVSEIEQGPKGVRIKFRR